MTAINSRTSNSQLGLSMADVLLLPPQQRKIVQWLIKHPDSVTLTQVSIHLDLNQQATLALLDELVDEGFVQQILTGGEVKYRVNLAAKRGIQQQNLQQTLAPGNPLAIIFNPSGDYAVQAGGKFDLNVTVTNKGQESALIDIFIDELSPQLIQWCDAPKQRLALSPNSVGEVLFEFQVPVTAIPSTYNYAIVVDAPLHYPEDTPIRHGAKIQVLPAIETVVRVSDPTFSLLPLTSSRSPAKIPPGGILQVNVNVHNRSDRVDRFRLSCLDLPEEWVSIRYPEGLETAGLVIPNMGLNLNPGEKGEILLQFQPPLGANAGLYYPSIRLYSANNPDLMLLDVIYWEILPSYLLNAEMLIVVNRVRRKGGTFEVKFTNAGNTVREITCQAVPVDEDQVCTYVTSPTVLRVLPGEKAATQVTVTPVKWWYRPMFGAGRLLNFRIELTDQQQFPLPNPALPGSLIWEPRPWWQFLLVLLTALGIIGAIAFLIWLWLFRPPAVPKILQFLSSDATYQASNNDFIRLSWQIRHPKKLQTISLTGLFADGTAAVQPIIYTFNGKLPQELQPFCQMGAVLTCSNVPTDARKPGEYTFQLQAFANNNPDLPADTIKTNTIKIVPIPPPQILEFSPAQSVYQEVKPSTTKISPDTIRLNWKINDLDKIKELRVIGRSLENLVNSPLQTYNVTQGIPDTIKAFCKQQDNQLNCRKIPANNRGAGDYIFELQVFTKTDIDKPSITQKTDLVKVQPLPSKILEFKIDGNNPLPKYPIVINPLKPNKPLNLSWKVEGSNNIKVELLPAPGDIPRNGTIPYPVNQQPGSETITLQVTNSTGEKVTRSVTIETFLPPNSATNQPQIPQLEGAKPEIPTPPTPPTTQPPGTYPGTSPSPSNNTAPNPNSPTPSQPDKLSPLELPPGFD
ncbi:hypothetical protein H6G80_13015 [Nostoc sp. FACHB-87]|uniref:hypothetical protein n=1 Tax=Nostocaceae TaxID=1162 RepID=UPI0016840D55|nr:MULTISPECIES: hypothetical protein [Nostocaceae]MBD2455003.1 hypothetical protein [Nostoc sp. FACHB-87]MBD2474676.1 hypothetical protein [Anabaena sp. FACHB-83]